MTDTTNAKSATAKPKAKPRAIRSPAVAVKRAQKAAKLVPKTIAICGVPGVNLAAIEAILRDAGVASAKQVSSGSITSIADWHDKFFSAQMKLGDALWPAKPWQLIAAEVFLANWEAPLWGWADARSTWLLDFWADFDPSMGFVLVVDTPSQALAKALVKEANLNFDASMQAWRAHTAELLRFQATHPYRAVIVNEQAFLTNPDAGLSAIGGALGVTLQSVGAQSHTAPTVNALADVLTQHVLMEEPDLLALQRRVDLVSKIQQLPHQERRITGIQGAIAEWGALQAVASESGLHKAELARLRARNAEVESLAASLKAANVDLQAELGRATADAKAAQADIYSLLQDLHNTQQELEATTSKLNTQQAESAELVRDRDARAVKFEVISRQLKEREADKVKLEKQIHSLTVEQEKVAALAQVQESKLKKLEADLASSAKQVKTLNADRDDLISSSKSLQVKLQELEGEKVAQSTKMKELDEACRQLNNVASQGNLENEQLLQLVQHLQEELEGHPEKVDASSSARDTKLENELLQQQLHQVQEELELYFQQYQIERERVGVLESKLAQAVALDAEPLANAIAQAVQIEQTAERTRWRVSGVWGGRRKPVPIEVTCTLGSNGATLEWDAIQAKDLFIEPQAVPLKLDASAIENGLADLAASDWHAVQAIVQSVLAGCNEPTPLRDGLACLSGHLQQLRPRLRFDGAQLKSERAIPEYEHLWLSLQNASYGSRHWKSFEFRIGAALVKRGQFSNHPRLEFPSVDGEIPQFENWFEECEDDIGCKYELRFELKNPAMDINAWKALSSEDHQLMFDLIRKLPEILNELAVQGEQITRPWHEWRDLIGAVTDVLNKCLNLEGTSALPLLK